MHHPLLLALLATGGASCVFGDPCTREHTRVEPTTEVAGLAEEDLRGVLDGVEWSVPIRWTDGTETELTIELVSVYDGFEEITLPDCLEGCNDLGWEDAACGGTRLGAGVSVAFTTADGRLVDETDGLAEVRAKRGLGGVIEWSLLADAWGEQLNGTFAEAGLDLGGCWTGDVRVLVKGEDTRVRSATLDHTASDERGDGCEVQLAETPA